MKTAYPAKILVAWAEAIRGNRGIREWLLKNGYRELAIFVFALHNQDDARKWLIDNGFQNLAATIAGAEGNEGATEWLRKYNFDVLMHTAMCGDGSDEAFRWLVNNGHREMAMVAMRIREVKERIEQNNNDIHKISPN